MSNENILEEEGCLSFPGVFIKTRRSMAIVVKDDGEFRYGVPMNGFAARALQHEIDHQNGIVMFDREYKEATQGRNEKCSCKSEKKYKQCCGKNL